MTAKVLTANRLSDGIVVYRTADGTWAEAISDASVARAADDETKLLAFGARSVAARQVVDPYLIEVSDDEFAVRPLRFREAIRATGPTVETAPDARALKR